MTADTRELVATALRYLEAVRRDGFSYIKAGMMLDELVAWEAAPLDLLVGPRPGSATLMAAMDKINARFGRGALFSAAVELEWAWAQRAAPRSPRCTTRIGELLVARASNLCVRQTPDGAQAPDRCRRSLPAEDAD